MSDIHQEWRELRQKNGDFICHLDDEMAKIEKKQVELKRREQKQNLLDAGAFAMQFVAPPPFNCCQDDRDILKALNKAQADRIKTLEEKLLAPNRSCSAYTQQGMQSKIAKQAAEIKRLTEENFDLKNTIALAQKSMEADGEELHTLRDENRQLSNALDLAAKDADANFERGKIKGMQEIWKELVDCYDGRPIGENNKIFGYHTVGDMLMNLSPTWFMNKAMEYHKDIQIGDEVEIFDLFDHSLSDIGIVIAIDNPCFTVIGPNFEGCFDETDIQSGTVKKTGQHFDSIPLNYLA